MHEKRKGIALIAAIMLIVFVSIAVLGLSVFIVQWFTQLNADQISAKCLYLAQAGVQDAIYQVRSKYLNPSTTYGSYTTGLATVDPGETYRRGATADSVAADFLLVNTANVSWNSGSRTLSGINVQKVLGSVLPTVTIASVNVCWTVTNGNVRNINRIIIGGTTWTGTLNSAACPGNNANINPDVVLNTSFVPVSLRWSGNIKLATVTMRFNMLDGSTKSVVLYPDASATKNCQFIINSTGEVAGSSIYRTIKATYDLIPATYSTDSKIADIDEINTKVNSP
jgi:hypothetical protein